MTIHILDELTINQMAAGEVIENTSSVIKELVENSLDARSTSIEIEVQSGGRAYIRVSDNGEGILFSEVPKAILRHATSKLSTFADLENLTTLGFRGEALASIASISKFSITTATESAKNATPNGSFFVAEGGKTITHVTVYRDKGTSIEVKDLFYNTPVRKAFQRSSNYDTQDILRTLTHLSFGYPHVAFRLIADKKILLDLEPQSLQERAKALLGNSANQATPLFVESDGVRLEGLLFSASDHRHNRMGQYTLLNNRPLYSHLISQAVKEGYGHALPESRYPQFVLNVTLDAKTIDVNVHPQKKEARFQRKGNLSYTITQAVQNCLFKQTTATISKEPSFSKMVWEAHDDFLFPTPKKKEEPFQEVLFQKPVQIPRMIASLKGYLITEKEGELYVVDIEKAIEHLYAIKEMPQMYPQSLLIPIEMEINQEMFLVLDEVTSLLKQVGVEISPFSQKSILIHAHPDGMGHVQDFVRSIFDQWKEGVLSQKSTQTLSKRKLCAQEAIHLLEKLETHPPKTGIFPITTELLDRMKHAFK